MFSNLKPLTGAALKDGNFVNFVERLAAYRDEEFHKAGVRRERNLQKAKEAYEADVAGVHAGYKKDMERAQFHFDTKQEAAERMVEDRLERGKEVPEGYQLAQSPHVNAAYDRKMEK